MNKPRELRKEFFPATAMPDNAWWSALWPDPDGIVRTLGIEAGMTVVDLCCGDGYFTAPLAELVNGNVYALDIDPEMLNQARSEVEWRGASVAEWLCADARDIAGLVPHEIDYVLIANTFHGVPDKTALAQAVWRVLKAGGPSPLSAGTRSPVSKPLCWISRAVPKPKCACRRSRSGRLSNRQGSS